MKLKINKQQLSTILLGLGCLLAIFSIFCFYAPAFKLVMGEEALVPSVNGPSMFIMMFGGTWFVELPDVPVLDFPVSASAGLTVLFVFAILALAAAIVVLAGYVSKKVKSEALMFVIGEMCLFLLIAVIMSFCTKQILNIADVELPFPSDSVELGSGAITYSVLGLVALLSTTGGIALSKKAA